MVLTARLYSVNCLEIIHHNFNIVKLLFAGGGGGLLLRWTGYYLSFYDVENPIFEKSYYVAVLCFRKLGKLSSFHVEE